MHPPEYQPHDNGNYYFEIFVIIFMGIICWPAVIIFMVLPWLIGQRKKLVKFMNTAIEYKLRIGDLYLAAWIVFTCMGWFFTIYYLCF